MSPRHLRRLGAAVLLAVGLLAATAVPASATAHDLTLTTSGTLTLPGSHSHLGGHATTNTCAVLSNSLAPSVIPIELSSTGGGTVGAATTRDSDIDVGPNRFEVRFVIVGGTITVTTSLSMTVTFKLEFRGCGSSSLLCRTNDITATLTGPNPSGSLHPSVSTAFTVSGTTPVLTVAHVPITCSNVIIRSALLGNVAAISWNVHLTS